MILKLTLIFFFLFFLFQVLYIFIPLYTFRAREFVYPATEKGISVLIPAYNESLVIQNCLNSFLHLNYQNLEVIFINDGSTDSTFETLDQHLLLTKTFKHKAGKLAHEKVTGTYQSQKYPHIWVINKENGGKADALNTGIEYAKEDIVITLDADSILDANALKEINRTFSDEDIIAAGGLVNIVQGFANDNRTFTPSFRMRGLIRFQVLQYLTAFYLHKATQAKLGTMTVIAGAFGAFRKHVLFQVNGYRKTVGEDMAVTLDIQTLIGTILKGKRIVFVPEAICYTECPEDFKNLFKQRIRWQKGFIDCVITFRKSFYRKMNFRTSTYLLFDSLLLGTLAAYPTLLVPIVLLVTMQHYELALLLFSFSIVLGLMQSIATILVSRRFGHLYQVKDYVRLLLFLPFEVMLFRLSGLIFVFFGNILYFLNKDGWNRAERIGKQIIINPEVNINVKDQIGG